MTDPSFAQQLITFTYPHIGNYGVSAEAMESDRVWARAAIMRAAINAEDAPGAERGWLDWLADCGIPAITGVDTRALVRHIRDAGAMRGGVFPARMPEAEARERIARRAADGRPRPRARGHARPDERVHGSGTGPRIAAIDTGIKGSIVRHLVARGAEVDAAPVHASPPTELLADDADPFFLANGPGDPAALDHIVADGPRAGRQAAGVGHLPRPPAALPGRRAGDLQAALRPPRRQPPGQGPDAPAGSRSPRRTTASRSRPPGGAARIDTDEAGALGDRLRRRRAHARQPLRPHRRGPHAARRPRRDRPVPPRGRPRAARRLYLFDRFLARPRPDAPPRRHPAGS